MRWLRRGGSHGMGIMTHREMVREAASEHIAASIVDASFPEVPRKLRRRMRAENLRSFGMVPVRAIQNLTLSNHARKLRNLTHRRCLGAATRPINCACLRREKTDRAGTPAARSSGGA
jgi:hypothetical protein